MSQKQDAYESKLVYTRRRKDTMYGLYARVKFFKGEPIFGIFTGDQVEDRDRYSIEIDDGHFMHPDGMFTNHSCDPSAMVDKGSGILFATRDIQVDDEITFDYRTTETEIEAGFICRCGTENCGVRIGWRDEKPDGPPNVAITMKNLYK